MASGNGRLSFSILLIAGISAFLGCQKQGGAQTLSNAASNAASAPPIELMCSELPAGAKVAQYFDTGRAKAFLACQNASDGKCMKILRSGSDRFGIIGKITAAACSQQLTSMNIKASVPKDSFALKEAQNSDQPSAQPVNGALSNLNLQSAAANTAPTDNTQDLIAIEMPSATCSSQQASTAAAPSSAEGQTSSSTAYVESGIKLAGGIGFAYSANMRWSTEKYTNDAEYGTQSGFNTALALELVLAAATCYNQEFKKSMREEKIFQEDREFRKDIMSTNRDTLAVMSEIATQMCLNAQSAKQTLSNDVSQTAINNGSGNAINSANIRNNVGLQACIHMRPVLQENKPSIAQNSQVITNGDTTIVTPVAKD